jgi:hypothetical protein
MSRAHTYIGRDTAQGDNIQLCGNSERKSSLLLYEKFPELRKTIEKIKLYILAELNIEPSKEELLYLVIHINRFCTRAGL